jgi:hypothetical protein
VSGVDLGLVAALASTLALNWGFCVQHGAASALPALSLRRPLRSLRSLFTHGRWTIGFVVGLGGWALYVLALRLAPLSLVQAVAAGGIGILALLAWSIGGTTPGGREVGGLVLALAGLGALALSLHGNGEQSSHGGIAAVLLWVGASIALAGAAVGGGSLLRAGAGFGIAAGVLYAAGDVATKAAVSGGARVFLVALVLACHGLAFAMLQLGFQRGGVLATAGLSSLFTNALPIVAGLAVFGEALPAGWMGVVRVLAFGAVVAGGAGLARGDGGEAHPGVRLSRDLACT